MLFANQTFSLPAASSPVNRTQVLLRLVWTRFCLIIYSSAILSAAFGGPPCEAAEAVARVGAGVYGRQFLDESTAGWVETRSVPFFVGGGVYDEWRVNSWLGRDSKRPLFCEGCVYDE